MRFILAAVAIAILSGCSSLLYFPAPQPYSDPSKFRHKPENVYFLTEDQVKIHAWYFKSPQRPAKATILFFHGNAQNLTTHFFALYWLLDHGYDYMIFDYRGYGESEGKPSPEGTIKDGKAALEWITRNKEPKTKLIIFGQSLGGAVAVRVACDTVGPEAPYEMVIIDSSFHSYRKAAQKVMSSSWLLWPFQWLGYLVMNDEFAPKSCVGDISPRPLLIVHGTADRTVNISLGERLFEIAKEPKEFWRIDGGGHTDFMFRADFPKHRARLLEWIEHQLKAQAPAQKSS